MRTCMGETCDLGLATLEGPAHALPQWARRSEVGKTWVTWLMDSLGTE
jgi:hypothetical protein